MSNDSARILSNAFKKAKEIIKKKQSENAPKSAQTAESNQAENTRKNDKATQKQNASVFHGFLKATDKHFSSSKFNSGTKADDARKEQLVTRQSQQMQDIFGEEYTKTEDKYKEEAKKAEATLQKIEKLETITGLCKHFGYSSLEQLKSAYKDVEGLEPIDFSPLEKRNYKKEDIQDIARKINDREKLLEEQKQEEIEKLIAQEQAEQDAIDAIIAASGENKEQVNLNELTGVYYNDSYAEEYREILRGQEPEKFALARTMFDNPSNAEQLLLQSCNGDVSEVADSLQSAFDSLGGDYYSGLFTDAEVSVDEQGNISINTSQFGKISFNSFVEQCKVLDIQNGLVVNQYKFISTIVSSDLELKTADTETAISNLTSTNTTIADDIKEGTELSKALYNAETKEDAYDVIYAHCGNNREVANRVYEYLIGYSSEETQNPYYQRENSSLLGKLYTNIGNKFVLNQDLLNAFAETEAYDYTIDATGNKTLLKRPTKEYYTNLNGELCTRTWDYAGEYPENYITISFKENDSTRDIEFYTSKNSIGETIYFIKPANEDDDPIAETQEEFFKRLAVAQNYSILNATNSSEMQFGSDMSTDNIERYYTILAQYDKNIGETLQIIEKEFSSEGILDDARNWLSKTFNIGTDKDELLAEVDAETLHTTIMSYYLNNQDDMAQELVNKELERRVNSANNFQEMYDTLLSYYGDKETALEILKNSVKLSEYNEYYPDFYFDDKGALKFTWFGLLHETLSCAASECSPEDFGFIGEDYKIEIIGTKYERKLSREEAYTFLSCNGEDTDENIIAYNVASDNFTDYNTAITSVEVLKQCKTPEDAFCLITGKKIGVDIITDEDIQKFNDFYKIETAKPQEYLPDELSPNYNTSGLSGGNGFLTSRLSIEYDKDNGFRVIYLGEDGITRPIEENSYYLPAEIRSYDVNALLQEINTNFGFADKLGMEKFDEYYAANKEQADKYIEDFAEYVVSLDENSEEYRYFAKVLSEKYGTVTKENIIKYINSSNETRYNESCKFMQYAYTSSKQALFGESRLDNITNQYCMDMASYSSNLSHILSMGCMISSVLFPAAAPVLMMGAKMAGYTDNTIDLINMLTNRQNYMDDDYLGWAKSTGFEWLTKRGYKFFSDIAGDKAQKFIEWTVDKTKFGSFFATNAFAQILLRGSSEAVIETGICIPWTMLVKGIQGGEYDLLDELKENFIYDFLPYARGWQDMLIGKVDTSLYAGNGNYYRINGSDEIAQLDDLGRILAVYDRVEDLNNDKATPKVKYDYDGEKTVITEFNPNGSIKGTSEHLTGEEYQKITHKDAEGKVVETKTAVQEGDNVKITTYKGEESDTAPKRVEIQDSQGRTLSIKQGNQTVEFDPKSGNATKTTITDSNDNTIATIEYKNRWGRQIATLKTADGEFEYKIDGKGNAVVELEDENNEDKQIVLDEQNILRMAQMGYSADDIGRIIYANDASETKLTTEQEKTFNALKNMPGFENITVQNLIATVKGIKYNEDETVEYGGFKFPSEELFLYDFSKAVRMLSDVEAKALKTNEFDNRFYDFYNRAIFGDEPKDMGLFKEIDEICSQYGIQIHMDNNIVRAGSENASEGSKTISSEWLATLQDTLEQLSRENNGTIGINGLKDIYITSLGFSSEAGVYKTIVVDGISINFDKSDAENLRHAINHEYSHLEDYKDLIINPDNVVDNGVGIRKYRSDIMVGAGNKNIPVIVKMLGFEALEGKGPSDIIKGLTSEYAVGKNFREFVAEVGGLIKDGAIVNENGRWTIIPDKLPPGTDTIHYGKDWDGSDTASRNLQRVMAVYDYLTGKINMDEVGKMAEEIKLQTADTPTDKPQADVLNEVETDKPIDKAKKVELDELLEEFSSYDIEENSPEYNKILELAETYDIPMEEAMYAVVDLKEDDERDKAIQLYKEYNGHHRTWEIALLVQSNISDDDIKVILDNTIHYCAIDPENNPNFETIAKLFRNERNESLDYCDAFKIWDIAEEIDSFVARHFANKQSSPQELETIRTFLASCEDYDDAMDKLMDIEDIDGGAGKFLEEAKLGLDGVDAARAQDLLLNCDNPEEALAKFNGLSNKVAKKLAITTLEDLQNNGIDINRFLDGTAIKMLKGNNNGEIQFIYDKKGKKGGSITVSYNNGKIQSVYYQIGEECSKEFYDVDHFDKWEDEHARVYRREFYNKNNLKLRDETYDEDERIEEVIYYDSKGNVCREDHYDYNPIDDDCDFDYYGIDVAYTKTVVRTTESDKPSTQTTEFFEKGKGYPSKRETVYYTTNESDTTKCEIIEEKIDPDTGKLQSSSLKMSEDQAREIYEHNDPAKDGKPTVLVRKSKDKDGNVAYKIFGSHNEEAYRDGAEVIIEENGKETIGTIKIEKDKDGNEELVIYQNNQVLLRHANESGENNITAFREVNENSKDGKAKVKTIVSFISIETVGFHLFQGYSLEGYTATNNEGEQVFYFVTEQNGETYYWERYVGTKGCYPVTKNAMEKEIGNEINNLQINEIDARFWSTRKKQKSNKANVSKIATETIPESEEKLVSEAESYKPLNESKAIEQTDKADEKPVDIEALVEKRIRSYQAEIEKLNLEGKPLPKHILTDDEILEATRISSELYVEYLKHEKEMTNMALEIFKENDSIAKLTSRAKSENSTYAKLIKAIQNGQTSVDNLDECKKAIADAYGTRIQVKNLTSEENREVVEAYLKDNKIDCTYDDYIAVLSGTADEETSKQIDNVKQREILQALKEKHTGAIVDTLVEGIKNGTIILADGKLNNYGNEESSYFTPKQLEKIADAYFDKTGRKLKIISLKAGIAKKPHLKDVKAIEDGEFELHESEKFTIQTKGSQKESGYATSQFKVMYKFDDGSIGYGEVQIRGTEVNAFGDVEHIPYDIKSGKLDGNDPKYEQMAYVLETMSDESRAQYDEAMKKIYAAQHSKELGIPIVKMPELPSTYTDKSGNTFDLLQYLSYDYLMNNFGHI